MVILDKKYTISKEVLENYREEHNFDCTGEQLSRYYQEQYSALFRIKH